MWLLPLLALFCWSLPNGHAQTPPVPPLQIQGETMGTYYSIIVDSPPPSAVPAELKKKVDAALAAFNREMSTWDPQSEISRFNQSQSLDWFPVGAGFAKVVTESKRIHELSGGLFDPTLGPLIDLWGFGKSKRRSVPKPEQIEEAKKHVGMYLVEVRAEPPAIRKLDPAVQINLSAIAPGYAIDLIAGMLKEEGYRSWLVDIGGEDQAGDAKAGNVPWKIGVESPLGEIHKVVELVNNCVATSGDYRNFFEIDGRRYSHALDPVSGWPVADPPASVSVFSSSSMTADALATVLMVMGTEQGMKFAEKHQLEVMFLEVDSLGKLKETSRGTFAAAATLSPPEALSTHANTQNGPEREPENQARVEDNPQPSNQDAAQSKWWLPFAAALGIFMLAMAGMSVGVIVRNKALKGSCGGLASMPGADGQSICDLCTKPKDDCINPEVKQRIRQNASADEEQT